MLYLPDTDTTEGAGGGGSADLAAYTDHFWARVDKKNGPIHPTLGRCWDWTASKFRHGYGQVANTAGVVPCGKTARAHRVSYFLSRGSMPGPDLVVRHLCHRPSCVRPSHLKEGTSRQNVEDSVKDVRYACGDGHFKARLTRDEVVALRERRLTGETIADLAADFGISEPTVSQICLGRTWAHFGGPLTAPMPGGRRVAPVPAEVRQ